MSGSLGFPTAPFLDENGDISLVWRQWLVGLQTRTETLPSAGQAASAIQLLPAASPFTYSAPFNGVLFASGGGIEAMTIRRGIGPAWKVGGFYGGVPLRRSDVLSITYLSAPTLVFFPG